MEAKYDALGLRNSFVKRLGIILGLNLLAQAGATQAAVDVLTWHGDQARTGQNLNEKWLTHANVAATTFGKLFNISVDGKVDAQPLYVSYLTIQGVLHNVVFIATEHDSVYACDADNGAILWQKTMLPMGETTSDNRNCSQVTPEIGITATPVIDRNQGPNGTIYVVAMSKDGSGNYFQRVHALDLATGADLVPAVQVVASYPGTGDGSSGGTVFFDPKQYKERPGLVDLNGRIYTYWSSHCDIRPYTGWVISYDKATLAQTSVLDLAPNGNEASLWGAGASPAIDSAGNQYALVANGTFDTTLNAQGFPTGGDYGNCFIKLGSATPVTVVDYWTMFNTVSESNADQDLGSGGAIVLPDMTDGNGVVRRLTVGAGKDTHIYLADRDNMGKFNSSSNSTLYQDVGSGVIGQCFATPAYFNGHVYFGGVSDTLKQFTFNQARLNTAPTTQTGITFPYPGTTPTISANGTQDPIVWCLYNASTAVLYAFDANDVSKQLYSSNDAAGSRDHFGTGNKFMVPTVTNGKVYAGTTNSVAVFGLLNQPRPASTEIKTFAKAGSTATLTIDSTTNFNYQLQHTDSLTNAFSNIGSPQNGTTGITLTFTDPNASASVGFYRIVIGP
jgi:hypothetical protein